MIYGSSSNARSFMRIYTIHWKGNRLEFGLPKLDFYLKEVLTHVTTRI